MNQHRNRNKNLGYVELVAIALGGMVGGGIFTVLGIAVANIGFLTPLAIVLGGIIAALAAYSYVKLGLFYRDEGATYAFYKKTYPRSSFAASVIGWYVTFGYISTLALYAYTFASYSLGMTDFGSSLWVRKAVAISILLLFTLINVWSVNGMGKIEDLMVYTKLLVLSFISIVLIQNSKMDIGQFVDQVQLDMGGVSFWSVFMLASLTFVAYEGFQLVINAVDEMEKPEQNIPRAIYTAITTAILIYVIIAIGALLSIPKEDIIKNQEYALAAGANNILGSLGKNLVIIGAVLATASAISGTLFGASRQMAVIASDGYLPAFLSKRKAKIPINAIIGMAGMASILILFGGLELILEFGSLTFLFVSFLMAVANFKIGKETQSSTTISILAMTGLLGGGCFILYYELTNKWEQLVAIIALYIFLALGALYFSKKRK